MLQIQNKPNNLERWKRQGSLPLVTWFALSFEGKAEYISKKETFYHFKAGKILSAGEVLSCLES